MSRGTRGIGRNRRTNQRVGEWAGMAALVIVGLVGAAWFLRLDLDPPETSREHRARRLADESQASV